jgi:putative DNA primase/helicase
MLEISIGASRKETKWTNTEITWAKLLERLGKTKRTSETLEAYLRADKTRQDEIKDIGGFVGGPVIGGRRKRGAVTQRWVLTLDIDFGHPGIWDAFTLLYDCAACVYSTHKHTPNKPRLRLVIPLSRAVDVEEYQAIGRRIAGDLGIDMFDKTTFEPERLMYWPSTAKDGVFEFQVQEGEMLDPHEVLCSYGNCSEMGKEAWRDVSKWPVPAGERAQVARELKRQRDPEDKDGVIGAFCRVYNIHEAIEAFLSDVYEPAMQDDNGEVLRYTYRQGSCASGAVVYDGKWLYSHHSTDPAGGILCNAFDLVRIHLFGDRGAKASQTEMMRFIVSDKATATRRTSELVELAKAAFTDEEDFAGGSGSSAGVVIDRHGEIVEDGSRGSGIAGLTTGESSSPATEDVDPMKWTEELEVDKKGNPAGTIPNILCVLHNHPDLRGRIKLNEFNSYICVTGDLPWAKLGKHSIEQGGKGYREWSDGDLACLMGMLQAMGMPGGHADKAIEAHVMSARGRWHPVREWLQGLKWDGVERMDELLIRYMGAEDCAYVREVTRRWLIAGVARIMNPGCKFDQMLVLVGPEGVGKSTLFRLLAGGLSGRGDWFSDSLLDMHSKDAMADLGGVWIMEVAELQSMKRSEVESVKRFISSTEDKFRPAYGRYTVNRPRQTILVGTTNTTQFIVNQGGARRFWPVEVGVSGVRGTDWGAGSANDLFTWDFYNGGGRFSGDRGIVGQIWAEAKARFDDGETFHNLSAIAIAEMGRIKEKHTLQDVWADVIEAYLHLPIGVRGAWREQWEAMSFYERRAKFNEFFDKWGSEETGELPKTAEDCLRDKVVSAEILCEALGYEKTNYTRNEAIRITNILENLGWKNSGKTMRTKGYGMCRYFVKKQRT